jgi:hypothetical protein
MIYQNMRDGDNVPIFPKTLYNSGCAFLSLIMSLVDKKFMVEPSPAQVMKVWIDENTSIGTEKDLGASTEVLDWQGLADSLIGSGKVKFLGKVAGNYVCNRDEFALDYWEWNKLTHFTYQDYDPWIPGSPVRFKGVKAGRRLFKVLPK